MFVDLAFVQMVSICNSLLVSLFLDVSHGFRVPLRTVAWQTCSCRWVYSEDTFLQRRRYRSRQYFVKVVKLPLTYLRPPNSAEAALLCLESSLRLWFREIGLSLVCLGHCLQLISMGWLRECFDSSVLICLTVLMIWVRDMLIYL